MSQPFTQEQRDELRDAFEQSHLEAALESVRLRAVTTCGRIKTLLTELETAAADLDDTKFSIAVAQIKPAIDTAANWLSQLKNEGSFS